MYLTSSKVKFEIGSLCLKPFALKEKTLNCKITSKVVQRSNWIVWLLYFMGIKFQSFDKHGLIRLINSDFFYVLTERY